MPGESPRLHPFTRRRVGAGTRPGTMARMGGVAVCALVLTVAGCAGGTGATPRENPPIASASPTPGAAADADEEIFRAAEDTYRAYVDALNKVDLADPATFEPVFAWLSGDALEDERDSLQDMHRAQLVVRGDSAIKAFHPERHPEVGITALACLDVSGVQLYDATGKRVATDQRPDVYTLRIVYSESTKSPTGSTISSSFAVKDGRC